jgi:2-keto-4-pentenoate hydratase/2-oxohepta-3-ene-1,7-dioic acid hydratase in catechol pathway
LATIQTPDGPRPAVHVGDHYVNLVATAPELPGSVRGILEGGAEVLRRVGEVAQRPAAVRLPANAVTLLAPILDPHKVLCIGLNYRDHAEESGQDIPQAPMWFAKFRNSLCGSGADIVLPAAYPDHVDYEAELALVIGRTARDVSSSDALAHGNPLWTSGKAIDTFAPCGPAIVTLDEAGDLQDLKLRTRIDGETFQEGTTANLIFGPAELVAWLSRTITLVPGDIIATGTPAGVGAAQGRFLRDGNLVEVEIDGIGTLSNTVRAE